MFSQLKFVFIPFALTQVLRFTAWRYPHFAARLKERNLVAQIKARDEGTGRWIEIRDGNIRSGAGEHPKPDITLAFKNAATGASLPRPRPSRRRAARRSSSFISSCGRYRSDDRSARDVV